MLPSLYFHLETFSLVPIGNIAYICYTHNAKEAPVSNAKVRKIEKEIEQIKEQLQEIGEMRPGSLTQQYRVPSKKLGGYYQLSYMHKMKSRTDYVRPQFVDQIRTQVATYKRFKKLVDRWIELAIIHSKLIMDIAKKKGAK
jgi:hypothetical protein